MRLITLSTLFVLALAGILPAQEGKVALEWKFKKGESLRYDLSVNMETDVAGMEISQEMAFRTLMEITDVTADGTATIKSTYERIKIKVEGGPMSSDFDSSKDKKPEDNDIMGRLFSAMVGKSLTITLAKNGMCQKVEGMEKIMEAAMKELPEELQGMGGMMKSNFSDEYSKSMMQMNFGFLPKTPVGKGEVWDDKASLSFGMLGKMDMKMKSTLKEFREGGKEAVVTQEVKLEFKPAEDGGGGPMGAMEISDSKMKSEMIWAVERGILQSTKGTMTMDMNAGGQDITLVWKMEMKLVTDQKDVATPGK